MVKVIDSTQYHLWTDALHGRALARQANNDWDRGTYVRWTVLSAWSAFEMVCGNVLEATGLGNDFRRKFDKALSDKHILAVDWGQGILQRVLRVYGIRKEFTHVHSTIDHARLLAPVSEADLSITVLRDAIKEVCRIAGLPSPLWVDDDSDRGWDTGRGSTAHATVVRTDVDPGAPDTIRIAYVINGQEHVCDIMPPRTPHGPVLDDLINRLNVPVGAVRAYQGDTLIEERPLRMRGG